MAKTLTAEQIARREIRAAKKAEIAAHVEKMNALKAKAREIVATGKCPDCGTPLVRNLSLSGWWQCGALGVDYMRKPEFRNLPHCGWQTFTE